MNRKLLYNKSHWQFSFIYFDKQPNIDIKLTNLGVKEDNKWTYFLNLFYSSSCSKLFPVKSILCGSIFPQHFFTKRNCFNLFQMCLSSLQSPEVMVPYCKSLCFDSFNQLNPYLHSFSCKSNSRIANITSQLFTTTPPTSDYLISQVSDLSDFSAISYSTRRTFFRVLFLFLLFLG